MSEPIELTHAPLRSQASLNAAYEEVRKIDQAHWLSEQRFRGGARGGGSSDPSVASLEAENDALKKRLDTLEQIVLERETKPETKGSKSK